jgi:hypothetical protein
MQIVNYSLWTNWCTAYSAVFVHVNKDLYRETKKEEEDFTWHEKNAYLPSFSQIHSTNQTSRREERELFFNRISTAIITKNKKIEIGWVRGKDCFIEPESLQFEGTRSAVLSPRGQRLVITVLGLITESRSSLPEGTSGVWSRFLP